MERISPTKTVISSRWQRIPRLLEEYLDKDLYPGFATLVYQGGRVIYSFEQGWMDVEAQKPLRPDAIYRIYSMTKPITCTALLMLFEEGKFFLDEPVYPYIPAFEDLQVYAGEGDSGPLLVPAERPVTFRMLLTHTAGLGYGFLGTPQDSFYRDAGLADWTTLAPNKPLVQLVETYARLPLAFQPGTKFNYSVADDVIGHLIEILSGQTFEAFLQERVFGPLGMVDTAFWVPPEKLDRLVSLYQYKDGKLILVDPPSGIYSRPPAAAMGGSGLVSTTADYLRFARMLLNRGELDGARLLARKTVELMASNHLAPEMLPWSVFPEFPSYGMGYGLGVGVLLDRVQAGKLTTNGTFGWSGAAGTHMFIDPGEDLVAILMTQTNGIVSDVLPPHSDLFERLVYQAL